MPMSIIRLETAVRYTRFYKCSYFDICLVVYKTLLLLISPFIHKCESHSQSTYQNKSTNSLNWSVAQSADMNVYGALKSIGKIHCTVDIDKVLAPSGCADVLLNRFSVQMPDRKTRIDVL